MSESDPSLLAKPVQTASPRDALKWREGAPLRAERLLARATLDAEQAQRETLPQRRQVLIESARRLTQLAEAELRLSDPGADD